MLAPQAEGRVSESESESEREREPTASIIEKKTKKPDLVYLNSKIYSLLAIFVHMTIK